MEDQNKEKSGVRRYRRDIIISIIMVLVVVQAVNLFFKIRTDREYNAEMEQTKEQITILEHELTERMTEIASLGGDVEDLQKAIAELEEEKEFLQVNRKYNQEEIRNLKNKVDGFQELLVLKDEEIAKLKNINEELAAENVVLKTEKNELTATLGEEKQNRQELEEKMAIAGRLRVENIRVLAINSRGRIRETDFKSRFIDQIRTEFNIAENELAPIEGKDIMVRIVGPDGNILFDVATGSGTFMFNGKEEFYTAKQQILFDNSRQKLLFDYDKGSEWQAGRYELQIFTEDYLMGDKPFIIK